MATSSLPPQPAAAAGAALDAAINDFHENGDSSATGSGAVEASSEAAAGQQQNSVRTVFNDPQNFNVKHPLYNTWTLWFDNPSAKGMGKAPGGKDSWGEDLNKVVDIDSVEEFWGLYSNIIPPSVLPPKANYYLFKRGVKPAWEDEANAKGGKWSIQLPREKSRAGIDTLWLFTMLSAIGETLEPANGGEELITGVIMAARPNLYRIAIWTSKAEDPEEAAAPGSVGNRLLEIGKHFKTQILGYDINAKIGGNLSSDVEFQSHKESEKKKGKKFVV